MLVEVSAANGAGNCLLSDEQRTRGSWLTLLPLYFSKPIIKPVGRKDFLKEEWLHSCEFVFETILPRHAIGPVRPEYLNHAERRVAVVPKGGSKERPMPVGVHPSEMAIEVSQKFGINMARREGLSSFDPGT
jgi:hypothetical protein